MEKIPALLDMHCHLRQANLKSRVIDYSLQSCTKVLAMPNLKKLLDPALSDDPIDTFDKFARYYLTDLQAESKILRTMALTDYLTIGEIESARRMQLFGIKLYPKGSTTNSSLGIKIQDLVVLPLWIQQIFDYLQQNKIPLLIHAEVPGVSFEKSEKQFIPILENILTQFPKIMLSIEHVSCKDMAKFIFVMNQTKSKKICGTITAHHLMIDVNDVLGRPYNYCRPPAKFQEDRIALIAMIKSQIPCFFLGSDSAPHYQIAKIEDCCPGCYTAPILPELLLTIFEKEDMLDRLKDFVFNYSNNWYDFRLNPSHDLYIKNEPFIASKLYKGLPVFWGGRKLNWKTQFTDKNIEERNV